MAENFNLIPAKDLPTTEAEEVDVLCVENGELKRKAGASLGGSGGGYIIRVPASDIQQSDDGSMSVTLTESYDNFAPILYSGGSVWLDISETGQPMYVSVITWAFAEGTLMLIAFLVDSLIQVTCPNGTIAPPTV